MSHRTASARTVIAAINAVGPGMRVPGRTTRTNLCIIFRRPDVIPECSTNIMAGRCQIIEYSPISTLFLITLYCSQRGANTKTQSLAAAISKPRLLAMAASACRGAARLTLVPIEWRVSHITSPEAMCRLRLLHASD